MGGFVWYGGAIVGGIVSMLFVRFKKWPLGPWLDLFAPIIALGYAIGRFACFLTGCCYGAVCVLADGTGFRHPTQLYATAWEAVALAILLWLEKQKLRNWPSGRIFSTWLIMHSIGRIVMESFRDDPRGPTPLGLSLATWISLGLITATLALTWRKAWRKAL